MNAWMLLWKIVLITGMILFAGMAVWVTIWGAFDIKKMLQALNAEHETDATAPDDEN